jgi:MFS family permease
MGSIGIISALLQAGYVRRSMTKVGEGNMARHGVLSCMFALFMLALLPRYVQTSTPTAFKLLQGAAVCIAFASATVVNSLTALASLQCEESRVDGATGKLSEEHPELAKGKALGTFRSSGQLGRALGPLLGRLRTIYPA